jgi:hypothetical protein
MFALQVFFLLHHPSKLADHAQTRLVQKKEDGQSSSLHPDGLSVANEVIRDVTGASLPANNVLVQSSMAPVSTTMEREKREHSFSVSIWSA